MEHLEFEISPRIKEDSPEFASLMMDKKSPSLQSFNTEWLNTRGTPNKPVKITRKTRFALQPFDILHFENAEINTCGAVLSEGRVVKENLTLFSQENKEIKSQEALAYAPYAAYKRLKKRLFIPLNLSELKGSVREFLSIVLGDSRQKRLENPAPKIFFHSLNWGCFSHFSFEEFPRLLATLRALSGENPSVLTGGGSR